MFDNARTYNEEGSMVYDDACILQRALEATLSEKTGESFASPIGTKSPLPAAFNAALQKSGETAPVAENPVSPGATFATNSEVPSATSAPTTVFSEQDKTAIDASHPSAE
ncbi:hypothetical protein IWW36_006197 [Coemansia brasiliensis]|uniref:Bromo domain-containing protein n=1 Tax=Coemansia brasiliensis TaxID=2650707 RepID=A0A9W8I052_9FUNG|nr:hypothetical protein IWW36_006197 [Coemansia brasiliensis]